MNQLYTERNALRSPVAKTWTVLPEVYGLLLGVCRKYLVNLSEQFPSLCPDGEGVCGVSEIDLFKFLKLRIPGLLRGGHPNPDAPILPQSDEFDQFSLFDYIEYITQNMVTVVKGGWHDYFHHYHLSFKHDSSDFKQFAGEINDIFKMSGLQYVLTDDRQIERITNADGFVRLAAKDVSFVSEKGIREIVTEAIALYHNARPAMHHLATEKIWDAFERIRTFYANLDKKCSVEKLIGEIANGNGAFEGLFSNEFRALTDIGSKFRIRHHETDKIDIDEASYCDYLFIRCLSVVDLAVRKVIAYE